MKALAVFSDPESARFKWLLKPGDRHVFACLNDDTYWTMFDWRNGCPVVQTVEAASFDLKGFFEAKTYRVVEVDQGPPIRAPFIVNNCVGMTKMVLCIRAPFAQTPYGLFCHLRGSP